MFARWGELVHRFRFVVLTVVGAGMLALGGYGYDLGNHLGTGGFEDPTSESAQAARLADAAFGRDHNADVIVLYTAPPGVALDDPAFSAAIIDNLNRLPRKHPQIDKINGAYWPTEHAPGQPSYFGKPDQNRAFASIAIKGDNDTDIVNNFRAVKDAFYIPGVDVQVAGLQPIAGALIDTLADDLQRMELLALPAVAVLLFFIFGGLVAAALPLILGGLTIISANGIVRLVTEFTPVNSFVSSVVTMIGLGLAIDYGLFIVSRFREELAEGYDTPTAVRRTVMTAGRTVVFSATMIVTSLGGMLFFPQGFLRSLAYGSIATVSLAALSAITILPAILGILGPRVDLLGVKRFSRTKTADEVENGLWGRSTRWVMKHPTKIAIPLTIGLLILIVPVKNIAFGTFSETYLPPDHSTRTAQHSFDTTFPLRKPDALQLVFVTDDTDATRQANRNAIGALLKRADQAPGLAEQKPGVPGQFAVPTASTSQPGIYRTEAPLADSTDTAAADATIDYLRTMDVPDNITMLVGGQPAIKKDTIDGMLGRIPFMVAVVLLLTTLLMFLTFGSLVLPIKAALMSVLGLGSTLGILTLIFVDGHGANLLNFTPQPIQANVLILIIAIIYGLSTDYEVFLLSRMVEARAKGATTTDAIRIGTAHTGGIITAAALILLVVTGAFAFSDLVMMQYIAYGMIAALFIDATILRMLLVPAVMKLLGDDCWWAPAWMKRLQQRAGLGEPALDDEHPATPGKSEIVETTPATVRLAEFEPQQPRH
ncbi:MMPL family transporter [Nocardia brasiliensis]|uniref:MMPL family transporter n=1 Tax=Nocardia brasiliensis TaxID=37326 RepID=A0A6G9XSW0_NOCBR|nr:MMPL family transporter [Nocardia brasiliensis]QIS03986.1 MMPL family transporter [Nocardia brasiliensis]